MYQIPQQPLESWVRHSLSYHLMSREKIATVSAELDEQFTALQSRNGTQESCSTYHYSFVHWFKGQNLKVLKLIELQTKAMLHLLCVFFTNHLKTIKRSQLQHWKFKEVVDSAVSDNNTNCSNIHNLLYLNLSAARVQAFGVSQDSTWDFVWFFF